MGRRKPKKSRLEELILAPWWLAFLVGIVAYVGIRFVMPAVFEQAFSSVAHAPVHGPRDGYQSTARIALAFFWLTAAVSWIRRTA